MTYQRTAGTISQGAHPGSYNGQDAYNDMLVVDDGTMYGNRPSERRNNAGGCPTLNNNHEQPIMMSDRKGHNSITEDGTASTLNEQKKERPIAATSIVRRLTPLECERLQGMPDNWSKYGMGENGEVYELSDSARYRLQGNGIATPFWKWLLKRISAQYERDPTLGSLFDGQASFPMLWEQINGKGSALWSSEIDKHAVAVAKYHFPDEGETT